MLFSLWSSFSKLKTKKYSWSFNEKIHCNDADEWRANEWVGFRQQTSSSRRRNLKSETTNRQLQQQQQHTTVVEGREEKRREKSVFKERTEQREHTERDNNSSSSNIRLQWHSSTTVTVYVQRNWQSKRRRRDMWVSERDRADRRQTDRGKERATPSSSDGGNGKEREREISSSEISSTIADLR